MLKSNRKLDGSGVLGKVLQVGALLPLMLTMLLAFSSPPAFAQHSGNALDFDGANDYINCGNHASLNITSALTIEAWIYYRGGETYPRIVQKSPAYTMLIDNSSGKLSWYGYIGGTEISVEFSNAVIPTNTWTHVAITYNGSALKAYINGEEKNSESYSGAISTTTNSLLLGNRSAGDRAFDGRIDEARIWNTARTQTEIQDNKNEVLNGDESGLIAYYRFDNISGTALSDRTVNDNDGALYNMVSSGAGNDWVASGVPMGQPILTSSSITGITTNSASGGGNVTDKGGSSVTARGVVWHTSENPTIDSYTGKTTDGSGLGSFTSSLGDLTSGQTYYVRAYATNSVGTGYGERKVFAPNMSPPGNALDFDGSNDYVNVGSDASFNVGNTLTIEAWVKPSNLSGRYGIFSTRFDNSSGSFQLEIGPGAGSNRVVVAGVGTYVAQTGDNAIAPNEWTHIAYTRGGTGAGTHTIYVNGVAQALVSDADYTFSNNGSNKVIASGTSGGQFLPGQIDELRVWSVARTETQIRDNMHHILSGDESNLAAYYRFDHLSGTALSDRTTNDNDGALNNMADEDWVTSTTPFGEDGTPVHTQTQTNIGEAGKQMQVTITTGGDDSNYLGIYRTGAGSAPISSGETFPGGVTQRVDILWGVEEYGTVTADIVFNYSNVAGISNPSAIRLLKRAGAASAWTDITADYVRNDGNRTFSKVGVQDFSEFSIGDGGDNSVPVELSAFHAEANERSNSITIYWVTESEVENLGFFLERCLHEQEDCQSEPEEAWLEITSYKTDDALTGQGSVTHRTEYSYEDLTVTPGESYDYRLADVSYDGTVTYYDLTLTGIEARPLPKIFKVYPNYPNLFNLITTIRYELPEQAYVNMIIYDLRGRQVRTLVDQQEEPGYKSIIWDGTNYRGQAVSAGIYFYQIRAGEYNRTMKIILLK
ncbi:MAG: T9SS type A sorting domain-containing protein [Candidatus Marinimicrobia bacterium]|nr:T9SS type A sorting domain-containing protein [Candidatus Neomarinimicrobiota bacterium]